MRVHFVLNDGGTPESKLADVEIHFEEGILSGLKLVGFSVWRAKKGERPAVLVPSRSYATAGGVRYFELLRAVNEGEDHGTTSTKYLKNYIRDEYEKIVAGRS